MRQSEMLSSSVILSVVCDLEDTNAQTIDVTFVNGRTYTHAGVPHSIVQGLVDAASAGRYYNQNLKGKFQQ